MRVALHVAGSSYTGDVSTFLTGIPNPVAVALSPGGTLFVGDWSTGIVYTITPA